MAIISIKNISKLEIVGNFKHVQVGIETVVFDSGIEIARTLHRHVISPGGDYSTELPDVQSACALYHTPEVISAYQAYIAAQ